MAQSEKLWSILEKADDTVIVIFIISEDVKPLRCIFQRPIETWNHFSVFVDENTDLLHGKISDTREYWQTT